MTCDKKISVDDDGNILWDNKLITECGVGMTNRQRPVPNDMLIWPVDKKVAVIPKSKEYRYGLREDLHLSTGDNEFRINGHDVERAINRTYCNKQRTKCLDEKIISLKEDVQLLQQMCHGQLTQKINSVDSELVELWETEEKSAHSIHSLEDRFEIFLDEIRNKLEELEESKMDKPSHSIDLENAEKYVDDYLAISTSFKKKRWARKQRMKKKLENLKRVNKEIKEDASMSASVRLSIAVATVIAIILTLGTALGLLGVL